MPSLEELRKLLERGIGNTKPPHIGEAAAWDTSGEADHLDDLTEEQLKPGVDLDKLKADRSKKRPPKYTKSTDGKDAIIGFGKYSGTSLRDIYKDEPTYLGWLLREFRVLSDKASKDFVDIVKLIIDEGK